MRLVGIRGAITVEKNTSEAIIEGTRELLQQMIEKNGLEDDQIISILFSTTDDLNADFPARAAREMGLVDTPLMCFKEINVPGSLTRCIRILMHAYTSRTKDEVKHLYLRKARFLRSDLI